MILGFRRNVMRALALGVVAFGVSGCGMMNADIFNDSFWASSPFKQNDEAELGIAELAKGNYVTAEGHFQKALKANSRDTTALIGSGILYQNTGQLVKAREMYEAVLALHPDESDQFVVWNQLTTRPISQIASVNLSLLETGGAMPASMPSAVAPAPVGGAPTGEAILGRAPQQTATLQNSPVSRAPMAQPMSPYGGDAMAPDPGLIGKFAGSDVNIVSRFETLRALRDQGLITQDEYQQRRRSNLGGLLPLTSPPPAAGLDRPVPTTEQISARLRAIGRALEMRAISVSQHAAERGIILDALLPTAPVRVSDPALPPRGLLEAADAVRRLEKLRDDGYISSDEYARERQAIELAAQTTPTSQPASQPAPQAAAADAPAAVAKPEPPKPTGPQPAIHLASYRSAKQAESGWTQIKRAHGNILGDISHEVDRVELGSKGTYFRLKAGPLASTAEARDLCSKLKARRQYCDPTVLGSGG